MNKAKIPAKTFFIIFGLNFLSGLLMINNYSEKRGMMILGFLIMTVSAIFLILTGKELYKARTRKAKM
ncbi:hypothetical protein QWJ34_15830 [Saccharibacillus sp. CPCC 101409]|uniref:hypothetical protein n=1 Tax=Saccharibacillus sp. CPCC 101409 TaxID=3058041 RepID=UPI002673C19C|nr:hypothetical protein [Saccharibacillus sp. CPCC 101409]MDO3411235.1 hypothetical protein [Saccharibacillus sp. CPCC 101409]